MPLWPAVGKRPSRPMTPQDQPKHARRTLLRATLLLALAAAVVAFAMPVGAAPAEKVLFCHATGSESNPYVPVEASAAGVFNGHLGEDHQNGEDIIPPFTYKDVVYSQNWNDDGEAIFEGGCGGGETQTETETETGTSSETETQTEEVPFFGGGGAPVVALGSLGALGGALLLLRRRL